MSNIPAAVEELGLIHTHLHRLRGLVTGLSLALSLEEDHNEESHFLSRDMVSIIESLLTETHDTIGLAGQALASIDQHLKD